MQAPVSMSSQRAQQQALAGQRGRQTSVYRSVHGTCCHRSLPARTVVCSAAAPGGAPASTRGGAPSRAVAVQLQAVQTQWWRRFVPGAPAAQQESEEVRYVDEAELEELLLAADASGRPLVITFSAHWCGPCKLLAKQLLATRADMRAAGVGAEFVTVEAPDHDALASRLRVHQLPCTFFVGGRGRGAPAMRMEGLLSAGVIEEAVRGKSQVLGSDLLRAIKL